MDQRTAMLIAAAETADNETLLQGIRHGDEEWHQICRREVEIRAFVGALDFWNGEFDD